jgi:hypothetical protein
MSAIKGTIHRQEVHGGDSARFYFWCRCGVCGPLRADRRLAVDDERLHLKVCAAKVAKVGRLRDGQG